jgi:hypothetical protein
VKHEKDFDLNYKLGGRLKIGKIKSEALNWASLVLQCDPVGLNDHGPTRQRPEHAPFRLFVPLGT